LGHGRSSLLRRLRASFHAPSSFALFFSLPFLSPLFDDAPPFVVDGGSLPFRSALVSGQGGLSGRALILSLEVYRPPSNFGYLRWQNLGSFCFSVLDEILCTFPGCSGVISHLDL
jgi:hypothetical protein